MVVMLGLYPIVGCLIRQLCCYL